MITKISKMTLPKYRSYLMYFILSEWKGKGHIRYINVCRARHFRNKFIQENIFGGIR